jgi:hypothetical protein
MSLLEEVAAQVRTVISDLGELRTGLDPALQHLERAGQAFARVGQGTAAGQLAQAVVACAETAERLVSAMTVTDKAREELWDYHQIIAPSMAGPRPTALPVAISQAGSSLPDARDPQPAPYISAFFDGLRVRQSVREPTDGVLTTSDGQRIEEVHSGKTGPGAGGPGLRFPWRNAETTLAHAEGHAAAIMRARGITRATLYVNNTPCGGPAGCDRLLPDVLPATATLTVYGPGGFCRVYAGTGRGLT